MMNSRSETTLERAFAFYWRALADGLPEPEREYRFASPRRWRFDFAWPAQRVAVECDGGTYSGGRHTRGDGYRRDAEKLNAAAALGWRVFRVTADMLRDDPHGIVDMVCAAVEGQEQSGFFASGREDISARIEDIVRGDEESE
jgi:very-short-patch-repair endonuclease